ncbi:AAA family ATPase [Acidovorax sp. Leaf76]|uniref:sigma-54-dependent transcriptional regulator n=1 Tax=unclassified Acidovorax TaxID=2684926 RepID=UPI0006F9CF50|nr:MULTISPECIES: sigma-54 dependent transcriptional regulator [unclassified Acidovorax]KQO26894.1 AAA family ATPase [Acidovorax sp. Leaf76]KQO40662.1 AAA family ATPase [Acidovorax sp. Leaf84]KQS42807.1 AAA family ATPase [Acidovorax sp. Leaf191]
MARLLIVDDDDAFRETLAETLEGLGHTADQAASGDAALEGMPRQRYDAVFLDHRMPGMDGLQTLAALQARLPRLPPVIVLTAYASGANTIDAMRLGAFDHLAKPIGRDAVIEVLARALRQETASPDTARQLAHGADGGGDGNDDENTLVGPSQAMREVHKRIGLAAASHVPVLVLGETGTGKDMVARALHRHSDRAHAPFVAINCAAIPPELLESELFGHVRGAFTGATGDRPGCFRAADGGVLLLDEIGDMALPVQAKILRVLQAGEVTPLGSHRTVKVDVRVVAATHHDLAAAVRAGRFREDLYYRLDVLSIRVPPLRERLADIVPLAEHFLRLAAGHGVPKALSADAAQALLQYRWPGNVRELRNRMERCQALVRHPVISAADVQGDLAHGSAPTDAHAVGAEGAASALPADWFDTELPVAVERLERLLIEQALQRAQGNRAEAARRLGIHRQLLYRKLSQYGLE